MNILDKLLQQVNYGISGPPRPGDTVVSMEPAGTSLQASDTLIQDEAEAG